MIFESQYLVDTPSILVATDEAGRGPLAGPVLAGAVAFYIKSGKDLVEVVQRLRALGVNDSKKLSASERTRLREHSMPELSVCWRSYTPEQIDELNILNASLEAMREAAESAIANLPKVSVVWLIDGHRKPRSANKGWRVETIIKGDSLSALIGYASIIAKVERDKIMQNYHQRYPVYGFDQHAGYPTKRHRQAIVQHGICEIHRKTFRGVREFVR